MKRHSDNQKTTGQWVGRFMAAMHRYDRGKMLSILNNAGLTTAQLAVLESARQSRTVSAMASDFGLSRPAMSQLVDKLVRAGFLRRSEGPNDRRERHVGIAPKGQQLVERVSTARAARFDAALAQVPAALVAELSGVLARVVTAMQEREPSEVMS